MGPSSLKFGNSGRIVTLQAPASFGNNHVAPGKITNLPVGGLNKSGALQNSKFDRGASRIDRRPEKSLSQARSRPRLSDRSRSNFGRSRFASTQFRGSRFGSGGGFGGRRFGGGGFGGGGFGGRGFGGGFGRR
jgi:hypothetical protein